MQDPSAPLYYLKLNLQVEKKIAQTKQETRVFQARVFQQRVFQEVAGCFKVKQTMQSKCTTYNSKKKVTAVIADH